VENVTVVYRTYYEHDSSSSEQSGEEHVLPTRGRNPIVYHLLILSVILIVICVIVLYYCTSHDETPPTFGSTYASQTSYFSSTADRYPRSAQSGYIQGRVPLN